MQRRHQITGVVGFDVHRISFIRLFYDSAVNTDVDSLNGDGNRAGALSLLCVRAVTLRRAPNPKCKGRPKIIDAYSTKYDLLRWLICSRGFAAGYGDGESKNDC
jgi:hypothetical protein